MHQDQRIGLALGMLLIGACAAFFFRNETREIVSTPRLQHAQELDDRIAERSTRPYLKGIEVVEAATQARARTVSNRDADVEADDDHVGSFWNPVESFTGKKTSKIVGGQRLPVASLTDSDVEELEPIPVPVYGGIAQDGANTSKAQPGRPSVTVQPHETASGGRVHVVQKGETLSSIAAKTLGSHHRFQELFEANKDQLKDPNDVRVGMTLHIPRADDVAAMKPLQPQSGSGAASKSVTQDRMDGTQRSSVTEESITPSVPDQHVAQETSPARSAAMERTEVNDAGNRSETPRAESPVASRRFVPARRFTKLVKPFHSAVESE